MSDESIPAVVELKIPCKPEFVGIARLAILGVASRMQFSYDEVEDVRLAVGEACTTAVERALKANKFNTDISIQSEIIGNKLTINIMDSIARLPDTQQSDDTFDEIDEQNLGALLMELLVDEFKVEQIPDGGTLVTMVKYAG
ncbi:MAG: ATP-binding protein [Armatimonadota bacterium]